MKEIEIKIINTDMKDFRSKISQLGATKTFSGEISSLVLDYADDKLHQKDSILRLRSFDNKRHELTFKGPQEKGPYKIRKEINITVTEPKDTLIMLKLLGLKVKRKIYKYRESYTLSLKFGNKKLTYHLDIDDYKIIPEFGEIEAKNVKELEYLIKLLKIPKKNLYNGSTRDILKLYHIKTGN